MASPQPGPSRFIDLPAEILNIIIEYTPYHTLLALRATMNRQIVSFISPTHLRTARDLHRNLLSESEDPQGPFLSLSLALSDLTVNTPAPSNPWMYPTPKAHLHKHHLPPSTTPRHNPTLAMPHSGIGSEQLFACTICFLCLPRWHFSARQSSQPTIAGSRRRFCIDCAVAERIWVPGSTTVDGCFICKGCTSFKLIGGQGLQVGTGAKYGRSSREDSQRPLDPRLAALRGEWWCHGCLGTVLADTGEEETGDGSAVGTGTSTRRNRCQRCWAIDHTEAKAEKELDGRPLCERCWALVT